MKTKTLKILMNVMLVLVLIGYKDVVNATSQLVESNKDSVVQVVLSYTSEEGTRYILQTGSGIVINNTTVLTNYHLVHLSKSNMKKAKKLVDTGEGNDLSHDAINVSIVKQDDVLIYAEITQESEEKDFALLTLSEATERTPAILGSSSTAVVAESVMAIGYPTTKPFSKKGAQLFAASDVNLILGVISGVGEGKIKVSGTISAGNSGGALVNAGTGEVIGLLVYKKEDAKKECFSVLPIDDIKNPYLAGTTYSDNSVVATTEAATTEEMVVEDEQVDKTELQQAIAAAKALNRDEYTENSYLYMYDAINDAEYVLTNENATKEEVEAAVNTLQNRKQALAVKEGTNWVLIIGIVTAVIIIVIIVIVVIVIMKMNKKEKERNEFKVLPSENLPVYNQTVPNRDSAIQTSEQEYAHQSVSQETTVLNMAGMNANNNATTVLNCSAPEQCAYLVRKKNGEKKKIDTIEFAVGKDASRVNYCISDNDTISRCHMKIIKKGVQYFVMDLGSTNHTYVNGAVIPPNKEFEVKNGDSIKVSDEEFIFEII